MEKKEQPTTSLYVHRCHKCGKPVTPKPTTLKTTDNIVILCSDCEKEEKLTIKESMRERKPIRPCPDGCGKTEYDLGEYRGFHLFQKPFYSGWWIYAEKTHPNDDLDQLLMNERIMSNKIFDDTEREAKPSLETVEKSVIDGIDEYWTRKQQIVLQASENKLKIE